MFKKFLLVVVVLIIGLCIFTGCSSGQAIEFRVGTVFGTGGEKTITKIVGSLANLSDSDIAGVISVDEKYDAVFFENNSLVIVAFATKTGGHK